MLAVPETLYARRLTRWCHSGSAPLRELIAQVPTLPPSAQAILAADPSPRVRRQVVLRRSMLPVSLLFSLTKDPDALVNELACHRLAANPAYWEDIVTFGDAAACSFLIFRPDVPPALLARMAARSDHGDPVALAWAPRTPTSVLRMLARDPNNHANVASNPQAPWDRLVPWARDPDPEIRGHLAINPAAPHSLLLRLAHDPDPWVRSFAANNPQLPPAAARRLAADSDSDIRRDVAQNPRTPPDVLAWLASEFPEQVAGNPHAAPDTLRALAIDRSALWFIRERAAANPALDRATLSTLIYDPDPNIQTAAIRNPRTPVAWAIARFADLSEGRYLALQHPRMPATLLWQAACDPDVLTRAQAALGHNAPSALLIHLATDASAFVRQAVLQHPRTPSLALRRLAQDPEAHIRMAALGHPNLSGEALRTLAPLVSDPVAAAAIVVHPHAPVDLSVQLLCRWIAGLAPTDPRWDDIHHLPLLTW